MREIVINGGYNVLVDDEDFDWLSRYSWTAMVVKGYVYAYTRITNKFGRRVKIMMHRAIMNYPDSLVDHKNGNTLDNQRHNLRKADYALNRVNSKAGGCTSRFRGVRLKKVGKYSYWYAQIKINGKTTFIGTFKDEEVAAKAYDDVAVKHFGQDIRLNFPERYGHTLGVITC